MKEPPSGFVKGLSYKLVVAHYFRFNLYFRFKYFESICNRHDLFRSIFCSLELLLPHFMTPSVQQTFFFLPDCQVECMKKQSSRINTLSLFYVCLKQRKDEKLCPSVLLPPLPFLPSSALTVCVKQLMAVKKRIRGRKE